MVSTLPSVSGRVVEESSSMGRTIYGSRPKLAKRSLERCCGVPELLRGADSQHRNPHRHIMACQPIFKRSGLREALSETRCELPLLDCNLMDFAGRPGLKMARCWRETNEDKPGTGGQESTRSATFFAAIRCRTPLVFFRSCHSVPHLHRSGG